MQLLESLSWEAGDEQPTVVEQLWVSDTAHRFNGGIARILEL